MQYDVFCFDSHFIINQIDGYISYLDLEEELLEYHIKRDDISGKIKVNTLTIATTEAISVENISAIDYFYDNIEAEEARVTGNAPVSTWPKKKVAIKRINIIAGYTTLNQEIDSDSLECLENAKTIRIDTQPELISETTICALLSVYKENPAVIEVDNEKLAQKIISAIARSESTFNKKAIITCIAQKIVIDVPGRYMEVSGYGNINDTHLAEVDIKKFDRLALECLDGQSESLTKQIQMLKKMNNTLHLQLNAKYGKMEEFLKYLTNQLEKSNITQLQSITINVLPGGNVAAIKGYINSMSTSIGPLNTFSFIRHPGWDHKNISDICPLGFKTTQKGNEVTYYYI